MLGRNQMAEKIENYKAEFLNIRPNRKAENDHKAKSTEYSGKNRAYWYYFGRLFGFVVEFGLIVFY